MKKYIQCQLRIEGLHQWGTCDIEEVKYLQHIHRHEFVIEITKNVVDSDREIEFIKFKHEVVEFLKKNYWSTSSQCHFFGNMSCEHIAEILIKEFKLYSCSVKEDGENGALIIEDCYA